MEGAVAVADGFVVACVCGLAVLSYQTDSILCGNSDYSVNDFLGTNMTDTKLDGGYAYVGAVWSKLCVAAASPPSSSHPRPLTSVILPPPRPSLVASLSSSVTFPRPVPPASRYPSPPNGGNGGLSLRRRSIMLEMTQKETRDTNWNEDVWFVDNIKKHYDADRAFPDQEVAMRFSFESLPLGGGHLDWALRPLGVHVGSSCKQRVRYPRQRRIMRQREWFSVGPRTSPASSADTCLCFQCSSTARRRGW